MSIGLSVRLSVCQSASPSVRRSISPYVCRSVSSSVCRSVSPSVGLSVRSSVRLSIGLSMRLSVGLSVWWDEPLERKGRFDKPTRKTVRSLIQNIEWSRETTKIKARHLLVRDSNRLSEATSGTEHSWQPQVLGQKRPQPPNLRLCYYRGTRP